VLLKDIYHFFIAEGIKEDLRPLNTIKKRLNELKKQYSNSKGAEKSVFDKDRLWNPYSDTRILNGDEKTKVEVILVGIDIEIGELLLADNLKKDGKKIDLILTHHPEGLALSGLEDVIKVQTGILQQLGIEKGIAEDLINKRIEEVGRKIHSANHMRMVDAARLLGLPFMSCHTPADNHVATYLQKKMDRKKPETLQDVVDLLLEEPEYKDACKLNAGPRILAGKPGDKAGKTFVDMTGGTSGSSEIYARLSQLGIKTQIGMHISENHFKKIKSEYMNAIVAGHIASDNLGLNLILDKLEKKTKIDILECSGFRRYRRKCR
jgi:putative NIF3 family GTP cyclohydrolase 1 type 2